MQYYDGSEYQVLNPKTNLNQISDWKNSIYNKSEIDSKLSNINSTLATFNGLRLLLPEKITSLIESEPRNDLTDCSPKTHLTASTTLLFPEPFGPTIHVVLSSSLISNLSAKDLKPVAIISFKYIDFTLFISIL